MRKILLAILVILTTFAAGMYFGMWLRRPLLLLPPNFHHKTADAGALDPEGGCELSWSFCWVRT